MSPDTSSRRSARAGFTLVEILIVAVVMGILAAVALPNLQKAILKARATALVSELHVIRVGVYNHLADLNSWPRDLNRGRIPASLVPYLPEGYSFVHEDYTLDFDNWSGRRRTPFDIGVTIIMQDRQLSAEVLRILGENTWTNGRDKVTWVIEAGG